MLKTFVSDIRINFRYNGEFSHDDLPVLEEYAKEHINNMLKKGYIEGELCCGLEDKEVRGHWEATETNFVDNWEFNP